jgi:HD-GYP domain-containing protein (c-di-GMP phosphodiesterase class II)
MSEAILKQSQEELIYSFSAISESKSEQTGQHIKRVSEYMRVMGKSICRSTEEQNALACAAMLHDVGKLMIPPEILDKPDKLTEEEYEIIKSHNKFGAALLKGVQGDMMKMAYDIALEHHERWDGKGYLGLKGEEISYYARYVSVIDVFDALISRRSYKNPWTVEEAYAEIIKHNGTQFAPDAIRVFQERFEELVKVHEMYPDE